MKNLMSCNGFLRYINTILAYLRCLFSMLDFKVSFYSNRYHLLFMIISVIIIMRFIIGLIVSSIFGIFCI